MVVLTIDRTATGQVSFDRAVITSSIITAAHSVTYSLNDPALNYTGTWDEVSLPSVTYRETNTPGASVALTFAGAAAIEAIGNLNWGHWLYEVRLDGGVVRPHGQPDGAFNASTLWLVPRTTLFLATNLDPTREHTIVLTHLGDQDYFKFSFSELNVIKLGDRWVLSWSHEYRR
jgi:hypothetical protein